MRLKIKVTKDILRKAMWCGTGKAPSPSLSTNCAIALAVRDIFPHAQISNKITTWVMVGRGEIDTIQLPIEAIEFIGWFDRLWRSPKKRLLMPELEFEIDVPDHIVEAINISDIHKSPTLEVVV